MFSRKLNAFVVNLIEPVANKYSTITTPTTRAAAKSNGNKTTSVKIARKPTRLFASVCIERLPIITSDMNDLEERYSNLINKLNVKKSYLSNHELRHLNDLERAAKKKSATEQEQEESELVIETALDYEDKCLKELQKLQFSERKLSSEFDLKIKTAAIAKENMKSIYQNVDYILDKKLILLVNDPITSTWQLPYIECTVDQASLRQSAEKLISNLNEKLIENSNEKSNKELVVEFMGNAPVGFYKSKVVETNQPFVDKHYFFKAQYKSGAQYLALSKIDFVWIRKDEMKDFIKKTDYLECLNSFILDF